MSYRVGIDIGGTFTDGVVIDQQGQLVEVKCTNTTQNLKVGFLQCIDALAEKLHLDRMAFLGQLDTLVHGTTQGTNAIIQRAGPRLGIIATKGHADTIQLRRVPKTNMWDWRQPYPQPLVARHLRVGVEERVDSKGGVVRPLDEAAVHQAVAYLKRLGVQSIVVTFLFSFLNPAHEKRVKTPLSMCLSWRALLNACKAG